jgi:signal peptide peptidase SppA
MKSIPAVLAAPWAIEPDWLRVVFGVWSRGQLDAPALAKARAEWEARGAQRPRLDESASAVPGTGGSLRIMGSVGVLAVDGPLFRHADLLTDVSGGTSYDALWKGLEAAEKNDQVKTILLRVNSPGGEADGVSELAKGIAAASKPVWAYVDGLCASAAYWLASQAKWIVAEETSEVGSIGVRLGIIDDSARMEAAGIRKIEIISSVSPGKRSHPIDDEVIGRLQMRVDDLAEKFVEAVATGRGASTKRVLEDFGKGDVFIAAKALDAGMVDDIADFTETLSNLEAWAFESPRSRVASAGNHQRGAITMRLSDGDNEWACKGCKQMMGPSADKYCAKCAEDDDDDDGDEPDEDDEKDAIALGLDAKTAHDDRRARMAALAGFEAQVFAATGKSERGEALAAIAGGAKAIGDVAALQESAAKLAAEGIQRDLRVTLERGLSGAPGKPATLSLGGIQKTLPVALRGETKKAWQAAMDHLATVADAGKTTVTAAQVIEAACSVSITAEDLAGIRECIASLPQVAATPFAEPHRDGVKEGEELDETAMLIKNAADKARATLDRGRGLAASAK